MILRLFLPDALDYSSPFVRFCRRVWLSMLPERILRRRRLLAHKEWLRDMRELSHERA